MLLFLSFAADDVEVAEKIAVWLKQRDFTICSGRGTRVDDPQITGGSLEHKISAADAFLAIMSPSFLASASCRRERVLALHQEPPDAASGPPYFIYVVEVRRTPYLDTGALRARAWVDMTTGGNEDIAFSELHSKLAAAVVSSGQRGSSSEPPSFHNRESELDEVLDGLTSQTGQLFWQIIAPPQLGKSWFLDRIEIRLEVRAPGRWTVKLVDVREKPPEVRRSAGALLGMLFGLDAPVSTDQDGLMELAGTLNRAGKPHLCLLDSAELIDKQTAKTLRECLSQIHKEIAKAPRPGVRLALIVASRGEGWGSVSPDPRLRKCTLSEFKVGIVAEALHDMSVRMGYSFSADDLRPYAVYVHRLCEGLPALLYQYLKWIHDVNWIGLHRLFEKRQFDRLTQPYIERELLDQGSLFGPGAAPTAEQRECVAKALEILVPYRLYTRAHLSRHMGPDGALQLLLEPMGWTMEKLLDAVDETDLLYRPQDQPWEVIYSPIRRLLCRYWYSLDASLAHAHSVAGQFMQSWGISQTGSERAVALVECLWHESQVLRLNRAVNPAQELIEFARRMSTVLLESPGWTPDELRRYAVHRMDEDEELVEAAERIGVSMEDLIAAVGVSQP